MLARMHHRGPDDEGIWSDADVALGHRRLAIVDLSSAGHQPLVTADGRLIATVNGEIYNYPALRRELEQLGHQFQSNSDSEIVLHAYRAWGTDSFARLNGMFAFGLWDRDRSRLFVVRDRLGIKPIYYLAESGLFSFASEIKALIAASDRNRWGIDACGLGQYLTLQNTLGQRSLIAGVAMVRAGHYLEVTRTGTVEHAYWIPALQSQTAAPGFEAAVDQFRATFSASVGRHLMSDVPVASYLSAGFDSTMVASVATRVSGRPPSTFVGSFTEGGWYDETSGARLVANHIGAPLSEVRIAAADFERAVDNVIMALDEPRMGMGSLPQYLVAQEAARSHKVILTGHGGDELFSGYPVFKMALLGRSLKAGNLSAFANMWKIRPSELPHLAYFALQCLRGGEGRYFLPVLFSSGLQKEALRPDVWAAVHEARSFAAIDAIADKSLTSYEQIILTYLQVYLPGLLVVEDKISMAHSLESRTPFLDNEMVGLSLGLPEDVKIHEGQLKAIIKEAARDVLPPALFSMPKRGFPTPLSTWLRGPLADWLRQRVCGPNTALATLFRREFLEKTTAEYLGSWRRAWRPLDELQTHRMWMLLSLESWLRQYEGRLGVVLESPA